MLLPDSVLAAIIAGTATLSASLLQLRSALLREAAGRSAAGATRRKKRLQLIILVVIVAAAGVSGFALSQWLTNGERAAQSVMQRELQARVAEIARTASQLELTRGSERAEIENGVLRRIGADGVVVMATVAACRPPLPPGTPGATTPPPAATEAAPPAAVCTEAAGEPGDAVRHHPGQCHRYGGGALQPGRRLRCHLEREPLSSGAGVRAGALRARSTPRAPPRRGCGRCARDSHTGPITRARCVSSCATLCRCELRIIAPCERRPEGSC